MNDIVLAILAKDKEYCLELYLNCILNQTFPKKNTRLWIRTNDNRDGTKEILDHFVKVYGHLYKSIIYNPSDIDSYLLELEEHHWNKERWKILGEIRNSSIEYAKEVNADYVVVDCDNFISPNAVENMYKNKDLGIVGPMLELGSNRGYSNFHHKSCPKGYMAEDDASYYQILEREIVGKIQVSTLHCTYFIPNKLLKYANYIDGSNDWEYVILSNNLKRNGIPQYLDNTEFYGFVYLEPFDKDRAYEDWLLEEWTPEVKSLMGF